MFEEREIEFVIFGRLQLRRSWLQPAADPLTASLQLLPPRSLAADLEVLLTSAFGQPPCDQQEPAPPASTLDVARRFEQPQEQVPEVVDQQAEARCQCGGVALAAAEPIKTPLVSQLQNPNEGMRVGGSELWARG